MKKSQLAELIFDQFRKTKSKSGHIVMMRVFNTSIIPSLNPKEQEAFPYVVNELIDNKYITYEDDQSGPECLRLTAKGFEYIYDNNAVLQCCFDSLLANDKVIKDTISWLDSYPEVSKLYNEAISKYEQNIFSRNILDDMRLSLETFLRIILNNNKSLENQVQEVGRFQKDKGFSAEFTNMFIKLLDYYGKYQNNYVKHNDDVNIKEIDFVIHLTTYFMRSFV